jgi:hypothetical protein
MKKRSKPSSFTTRNGVLLTLAIGTFVALISLLVWYAYVEPLRKSME